MKRTIINPRVWAIATILGVAVILIIAVPAEGTSLAKWLLLLAASKGAAFLMLALACGLYKRWESRNKLGELANWLNKEE